MAAVPPAPGVPPGPPGPPAAPAPVPDTYVGLYAERGDDLGGNYASLFDRYTDMAGISAQALWNRTTQASATTGVPKVYAFLVVQNNEHVIVTVHRPTLFRGHPVEVTPHDGRAYAFYGDKQENDDYIELLDSR